MRTLSEPTEAHAAAGAADAHLALRNGLKLAASLVFTWGIALAIRLVLPRRLGPLRFGALNFADAFTATAFVALSLGLDTYVRREIAVRPAHASDFFGGLVALRLALTALVIAGIAVFLGVTGRDAEVRHVVYVYAVAQLFIAWNSTFSAMLQARGRVDGMSVLAVATKVIWAGGVLVAMAVGAGLWAYAAAVLASESVETVVLYAFARRHVGLTFRFDAGATRQVVVASVPFFVATGAQLVYGRLGVTFLELRADSREVGWNGAASALAGIALMGAPILVGVVTPMLARAAARSTDELFQLMRRIVEYVVVTVSPLALLLYLGADVWVKLVFGPAYAPAASTVRVMAPAFIVTCVAMINSTVLILRGNAWTVTAASVGGVFLNALLNFSFIGHLDPLLRGDGAAGASSALAMFVTELALFAVQSVALQGEAFDRRALRRLVITALACAAVVALDVALRPLGPLRLVADAGAYLVLSVAGGALDVREIVGFARSALKARAG